MKLEQVKQPEQTNAWLNYLPLMEAPFLPPSKKKRNPLKSLLSKQDDCAVLHNTSCYKNNFNE